MRTTRLQVAWLVAALGIAAGAASAQAPTEAVRRADELFREGRALLDQGKFAEA